MIETYIQIQDGMAADPDTETWDMNERDGEIHRNALGVFIVKIDDHRPLDGPGSRPSRAEQEAFELAYLQHRIKEQVEAAIIGTNQEGRLIEILYDTYDFKSGLVSCKWMAPV